MKPAKILIVEDEGIVALDIENRLRRTGYASVAVAASGEGAVRLATEMHPDLVLMDIGLTGDIDGVAAAERIRGLCDVPVVYLTAYTDRETRERADKTVPSAYLVKPFEEAELRDAVETALRPSGEAP